MAVWARPFLLQPDLQSLIPNPVETLSDTVRRVDEDRWLASRFAPADVRQRLIALYAVNYEIARTAETVRAAPLGDIRLAWWREGLDEIHAGKSPRAHPALEAYAAAHRTSPYLEASWSALIEARGADFELAPFESLDAIIRYVDQTAGSLMQSAIAVCDAQFQAPAFVTSAARAWGLTGLLRAAPVWAARGRTLLPAGSSAEDLRIVVRAAYAEAHEVARDLPARVFPAVGYVALTPRYLSASANPPSLIERQLRLIVASATGRL